MACCQWKDPRLLKDVEYLVSANQSSQGIAGHLGPAILSSMFFIFNAKFSVHSETDTSKILMRKYAVEIMWVNKPLHIWEELFLSLISIAIAICSGTVGTEKTLVQKRNCNSKQYLKSSSVSILMSRHNSTLYQSNIMKTYELVNQNC